MRNCGKSGATLMKKANKPYWKLKQYRAALESKPQIVVIKLGTNDSRPDNWSFKDGFVDDYVELVKSFQELDLKSISRVYINACPVA